MVSGREWRASADAECWRRGGRKAASGFPPDHSPAVAPLRVSRGRNSAAGRLATLKVRADFLRIAAARRKAVTPGLVLQAASHPSAGDRAAVGVGYTASRRVGGAVARNRAKRRLRAVAAEVLPGRAQPGVDYVLIARAGTIRRPYAALVADLESALRRVGRADGANRRVRAGKE